MYSNVYARYNMTYTGCSKAQQGIVLLIVWFLRVGMFVSARHAGLSCLCEHRRVHTVQSWESRACFVSLMSHTVVICLRKLGFTILAQIGLAKLSHVY